METNNNEPLKISRTVEQPELLTEAVLNAASDSLLVLDHDLNIKLANRSFYCTFRYGPRATVGKHCTNLRTVSGGYRSSGLGSGKAPWGRRRRT